MNIATVKTALESWVSGQTTKEVVWANQNAPRPAGAFLTLKLDGINPLGDVSKAPPDSESGIATVSRSTEFTLSVQAFGAGAMQTLLDLELSLQTVDVQTVLQASGLAYIDIQSITDLTGLLEKTWEERASLDLRFRTGSSTSETAGVIERVTTIEGTYSWA